MTISNHKDDRLVNLSLASSGAAVLELDDAAHFNAIRPELFGDLVKALNYLRVEQSFNAVVLQARGPHFCIGDRSIT